MSAMECNGTKILLLISVDYSVRIHFKYLQLSEVFIDRNTLNNILLWKKIKNICCYSKDQKT